VCSSDLAASRPAASNTSSKAEIASGGGVVSATPVASGGVVNKASLLAMLNGGAPSA
jgi:hypothetical protein